LIKHLIDVDVLKSEIILQAFKKVDRKDFVIEKLKNKAYEDIPLSVGHEQTISQPYTVAFMLELLSPQKGENILDVGSGSGYTTALLSEIAGEGGQVISVEIIPELVMMGQKNISKYNFQNSKIIQATKNVIGFPEESPYDKILVSAEAKEIPKDLIKQLKIGGIMVIPVDNDICRVEKFSNNDLKIEKYEGFSFVPLIVNIENKF
jgi:protein-L-isoaspartate(D-aspartate) O-methyltransferase